jgi:hypothetical protein
MRKLFLLFAIYFSILPAIAFAGRHSFPSQTGKGASAAFKPRHVHGCELAAQPTPIGITESLGLCFPIASRLSRGTGNSR